MDKLDYFGEVTVLDPEIRPESDQHLESHQADNDWPLSSRYYDPLNMDATQISALISDDMEFVQARLPWRVDYLYLERNGRTRRCHSSAGETHDDGIFSPPVLDSRLTVVHVPQSRSYMGRKTVSGVSIDRPTWLALLQRFDILPSFLELLHSNNGGTMVHTSDRSHKNAVNQSVGPKPSEDGPQAFHLGYKTGNWFYEDYKTGNWSNHENAIYARRDLTSSRSFILLVGTDFSAGLDRVQSLLEANSEANFLHVIHALQSVHLTHAEIVRWDLDYRVRQLESQTGVAFFPAHRIMPLREDELKVNKQLTVTDGYLCNAAWGYKRIRLHFEAFLKHLLEFDRLSGDSSPARVKASTIRDLQNSCEMKKELAQSQHDQIQELRGRIRNQLEVTASLMAQRDTQSNIIIAKSTKRDSELMRGIAAVTMIFLPATFVAAFFSMVFFHVGDKSSVHLIVDRRIWLYFAVTAPLTLVVAIWYLAWSRRKEDTVDAGNDGTGGVQYEQVRSPLRKQRMYAMNGIE